MDGLYSSCMSLHEAARAILTQDNAAVALNTMHCASVHDAVCQAQRMGEANTTVSGQIACSRLQASKQPAHSIRDAAPAISWVLEQIGEIKLCCEAATVVRSKMDCADLAHDLSKAHGLIDARNGSRQVCQE